MVAMKNDYEAFRSKKFVSRRSRNRARKKLLDSLPVDRRAAFIEAEKADVNEVKSARTVIEKRLSESHSYISSSPNPEDRDQ